MFLVKSASNLKFQALSSLSHRVASTVCESIMTISEATLRDKLNRNLKIEHLVSQNYIRHIVESESYILL